MHFTMITMAKPALLYLEGHIFYSVSFTYKGEHGWGRGKGRKSTPSTQGIAAVIANGPGEPIIRCCARLCPLSACHVVLR